MDGLDVPDLDWVPVGEWVYDADGDGWQKLSAVGAVGGSWEWSGGVMKAPGDALVEQYGPLWRAAPLSRQDADKLRSELVEAARVVREVGHYAGGDMLVDIVKRYYGEK